MSKTIDGFKFIYVLNQIQVFFSNSNKVLAPCFLKKKKDKKPLTKRLKTNVKKQHFLSLKHGIDFVNSKIIFNIFTA
jgi:hypothetical protein